MALPNISIGALKRKNTESQAARDAEKRGSTPTSPQQTGR